MANDFFSTKHRPEPDPNDPLIAASKATQAMHVLERATVNLPDPMDATAVLSEIQAQLRHVSQTVQNLAAAHQEVSDAHHPDIDPAARTDRAHVVGEILKSAGRRLERSRERLVAAWQLSETVVWPKRLTPPAGSAARVLREAPPHDPGPPPTPPALRPGPEGPPRAGGGDVQGIDGLRT